MGVQFSHGGPNHTHREWIIMAKNRIRLYDGRFFGVKVSRYGMEHGYLDYRSLALMLGDHILNNTVRAETLLDWEIVNGEYDKDVYQDYIISEEGFEFLQRYTDEIVFYNEKLDIYLWGVTHFSTGWDYVLTDVQIEN